jgi:hypothetical protein
LSQVDARSLISGVSDLEETSNRGLICPVNPQVDGHFRDYSQALNSQSDRIRRDYPMHSGEAGRSREIAVREFFSSNLPSAIGVKEGFVIDSKGGISKQSDLLLIDEIWNKPIGSGPNPFWLRESVYASIEIKTNLNRIEIADAIAKCRAFKSLQPDWTNSGKVPPNQDVLFGVWAFESPSVETSIDNLAEAIQDVPTLLQPDFLVVPGKFYAYSGPLHILLSAGGSAYLQNRQTWDQEARVNLLGAPIVQAFDGPHAITLALFFLNNWISGAGPRSANIINYMTGVNLGRSVWSSLRHPPANSPTG